MVDFSTAPRLFFRRKYVDLYSLALTIYLDSLTTRTHLRQIQSSADPIAHVLYSKVNLS